METNFILPQSSPRIPVELNNLCGNEWVTPRSGKFLEVKSPYTGNLFARVPVSSATDIDRVVSAAQAAFANWSVLPIKERSTPLYRFRAALFDNLDELANCAAYEAGKTIAEAKAGILKGLEVIDFALSLQNLNSGGLMEVSRGVTCESTRRPLGVVAGIVPFNFPAMVPLWMFPIAITVGNCFILKPSEKVPATATRMAQLMLESGYPAGVFGIVHGDRQTAEILIANANVKAVAFVGSTPAAKAVYQSASSLGKRALTLGGAKNHIIVVPDANESITIQGVVDSFTGCCGQRCMAASVMLSVGDSDRLISKIVSRASQLIPGSQLGAIIDSSAMERIRRAIENAEKAGAKVVLDGRSIKPPAGCERGNWIGPTIIDHANPQMECATMEIFGPVLTIIRVPTLQAALAIESTSVYGNATSVFTSSGTVARHVTENASSGMIGINIGVPVPREPFSFGGRKESKFGACDITGASAVEFWTELRKVIVKWAAQSDSNWMS